MILTALRALAATPDLWRKYVDEPGYDKLLFRKSDFVDPHNSELHADLMNSPDELVSELAAALFDSYYGTIERVPSLDEILDPFEKVEQYLSDRDWDAALQLIQRKGIEKEVPPGCKEPSAKRSIGSIVARRSRRRLSRETKSTCKGSTCRACWTITPRHRKRCRSLVRPAR